jgi:acetyl esterase/lipase
MSWRARVHPELLPLLRKVPNVTFGPFVRRAFRLLMRAAPVGAPTGGVTMRSVALGAQRVLVFTPPGEARGRGALLWLHGGGRIVGRPETEVRHASRWAEELGIVVVAASYRLAPEHVFPAALDDAWAAWGWIQERAGELGVDPARVAVGGESAGGGLAAELAQRLHDEPGRDPAAQLLVCPMLDDRTAADADLTAREHLVWNNTSNHYGWSCYLGVEPGADQLPEYASASRREDVSGLAPAWIGVGDLDLFHDEDVAYARRLEAAGVRADLHLVEGGFHAIFTVGRGETPVLAMRESMDTFLREVLGL